MGAVKRHFWDEINGQADMQSDEGVEAYFEDMRSGLVVDLFDRIDELEETLKTITDRLPINTKITLDPEFIVVQRTIIAMKQILPGLE